VTWTRNQVLRRVFPERANTEWSDPSERVHLVERVLPDGWAGGRLIDLERSSEIRLVAITRAGVTQLASPALIGQEGDVLYVAVSGTNAELFEKLLASGPDS
jgi:trk system potassium uptake protein TrkA